MITSGYVACEQALHLGEIVKSTRARGTRQETRRHRRACSQASGYGTKITRSFITYAGWRKRKTLLGATRAAQSFKVQLWAGMSIEHQDALTEAWLHQTFTEACEKAVDGQSPGNYHCNGGHLLLCQRKSCHPQVFLSAWPFRRKFIFT